MSPPNKRPQDLTTHEEDDQKETEKDPAVERGERIDTGKRIARGGKEEGAVPGAEADE